jgi:hypothetical protein
MKVLSKGKLVIAGAFAAFVMTAPTASKGRPSGNLPVPPLEVSPTQPQIVVSHAAEEAIKGKLEIAAVRITAPFVREGGPPWVQFHRSSALRNG